MKVYLTFCMKTGLMNYLEESKVIKNTYLKQSRTVFLYENMCFPGFSSSVRSPLHCGLPGVIPFV